MIHAIRPDALALLLFDATLKATILLGLALVVARGARRSSAAIRHRVWSSTLCGILALPILASVAPSLLVLPLPRSFSERVASPAKPTPRSAPLVSTRPDEPDPAGTRRISLLPDNSRPHPAKIIGAGRSPLATGVRREPGSHQDQSAPGSWTVAGLGLAIWAFGVVVVVVPTMAGLVANEVRRVRADQVVAGEWLAQAREVGLQLHVGRRVELRTSRDALIPLTWGSFRPVVLLPSASCSWSDSMRRAVMLHEMAHVARFDTLTLLAGRIAAALYWFHPLAWYALHRMRIECEHACDDRVVNAGESPADYAQMLLELVQTLRLPRWAVAVAMSRRHLLEDRMIALFDDDRSHQPLDRRVGRRLLALSGLVVGGLALVQPGPQVDAALPQTPASSPAPTAVLAPAVGPKLAEASGRIMGRVVGEDGKAPVSGAEIIVLLPPPDGQYYYVKYPIRRAKTNADGSFSVDGLAPGKHRVWANFGKLTSRRKRTEGAVVEVAGAGDAVQPLVLQLGPGVALAVVVWDRATDRPIPDANVHITWSDFDADPRTDRDGRALLQPMRAESWEVEAWAPGFARQTQTIDLKSGEDAGIEFLLGPGGDLTGTVRDGSGQPLAGARISALMAGQFRPIVSVDSDAQGRYRLANLPRNFAIQVGVSRDDFLPSDVPARVEGPSGMLDLTLQPRPHGGTVVGVVLDHQGQPLAGAQLVNTGNSTGDTRETRTGPDGRFRLDNLFTSQTFGKEVVVRAAGSAPKRVKVETGPPDHPAETTIRLDAGHRIRGRVVDEAGHPLEGVRVYFADGNHAFSNGGHGDTDKQGVFHFESLPPGCPFAFVKDGFSQVENCKLPLDTDEVITVRLNPAGVIVGRVVDAQTGRVIPASNVRVTFSPERRNDDPSNSLVASLSDPGQNFQSNEGAFRLTDLVVGMPLQVTVSAQGYERTVVKRVVVARPDSAQSDTYRLIPTDPASLRRYRGRLLDAQGKPVVGAQIRLVVSKDRVPANSIEFPFNWTMIETGQIADQFQVTRFLKATSDSEGRFDFGNVPRQDQAELVWWGDGVVPGRRDGLEKNRDDISIEVKMPEPAQVVGTIDRQAFEGEISVRVAPTGLSLPDTEVELKRGQSTFEVNALAPGEYWVTVDGPAVRVDDGNSFTNTLLASEKITLRPGEVRRIHFSKSSKEPRDTR